MLNKKIIVRKLFRVSKFFLLGSIIIFSFYSQSISNIFLLSSAMEPYPDENPEPVVQTNDIAVQTHITSNSITTNDNLHLSNSQDTRPFAQSNLVSKNNDRSPSYIGHAPISIDGDADFLAQNASDPFCWTGDGTLATPYVIEDLNITTSSIDACIAITNIQNIHFTIRDCWLDGNDLGGYAIDLSDIATQTIIADNIIQNATNFYIKVWDSSGFIISNNSLLNLDDSHAINTGILIHNGTVNGAFIRIHDNNFYATGNAGDAITLFDCNNNTIVNNNITGSDTASYDCGIHLFNSNNTKIEKNRLNKTYEGIWAESPSYNITIQANFIQDTTKGINFEYMRGICSVWGNTVNNSAQEGMIIGTSSQIKVLDFRDNLISNCAKGFITRGSNHTIWNNTLLNNDYGIYLDTNADNVTIWANRFLSSTNSH
ncbi:MAG: NosD domain-containing protein, partial [Candidatus Hodarchaeota archaeon]